MELETRDFGRITIDDDSVITFRQPVYGFDEHKRYVFITQEDLSPDFMWMQSVEEPELCFLLANPELVVSSYTPQIPGAVQEMLGDDDYMCWLLVVLKDTLEESTVNLKSPVVVNPARRLAAQVVLEEDFPIRAPLLGRKGER